MYLDLNLFQLLLPSLRYCVRSRLIATMAASQELLTSPLTNMSVTKSPVTPGRTISDTTVDTEAGRPLVAQHTSALASMSSVKKTVLLLIFSMAQFLDVCQVSGVAIAVAEISHDTQLQYEQSVWIITAYSLAFCSFLLFAGRLSDLFPARIIFCGGFFMLGAITLGTSFAGGSKYAFLVLRGLGGVFGAATIPSAIHLIVHMYPEPAEQQAKLALFGVSGALGNVLGLVLAGIFMLANWRWFFRFITIICIPGSILTFLLLPKVGASYDRHAIPGPLWKRLDLGGVFIMIVTLALLNTGLTQGPIMGWNNAQFIAPFTISMVGFIVFFVYERWIDQANALLPTSVIRIKNFKILMVGALTPFAFWATTQLQYAQYLQEVRHWSPIHTAAAILPQGIMGLVIGGLTQAIPSIISKPRYPVFAGGVLMIGGTILVIFSDGGYGTDYWAFIFTGYVLGSTGACLVFFACNVGVIRAVPPAMAGVAGGIVQVSLQVGGIVGLTALAGLSATGNGIQDWDSSRSGFYFLIAWIAIIIIAFVLLYRTVPDEELPGAIPAGGKAQAVAVEKAEAH